MPKFNVNVSSKKNELKHMVNLGISNSMLKNWSKLEHSHKKHIVWKHGPF